MVVFFLVANPQRTGVYRTTWTCAERWTVRKRFWRLGNFQHHHVLRHMRWLLSLRQTRTRQRTYLVDFSVSCWQFDAITFWRANMASWKIRDVLMFDSFWFRLFEVKWNFQCQRFHNIVERYSQVQNRDVAIYYWTFLIHDTDTSRHRQWRSFHSYQSISGQLKNCFSTLSNF